MTSTPTGRGGTPRAARRASRRPSQSPLKSRLSSTHTFQGVQNSQNLPKWRARTATADTSELVSKMSAFAYATKGVLATLWAAAKRSETRGVPQLLHRIDGTCSGPHSRAISATPSSLPKSTTRELPRGRGYEPPNARSAAPGGWRGYGGHGERLDSSTCCPRSSRPRLPAPSCGRSDAGRFRWPPQRADGGCEWVPPPLSAGLGQAGLACSPS
jgi:hypothetical protein